MPGGEIESEKWAEHSFAALWPGKSYRAMGRNVRPDYVIDGRIAVEVTRLTDNTEKATALLTNVLNGVFLAYGVQHDKSKWDVYCVCEPELLETPLQGRANIRHLKRAAQEAIEDAQAKFGEPTDEYVCIEVPLCGIGSCLGLVRSKSCAFREGIRSSHELYRSACGCRAYLRMLKHRSGNLRLKENKPNFHLVQVHSNSGGFVLSDTLTALREAVPRKSRLISEEELQKYEGWWMILPDYVNVLASGGVEEQEHEEIQSYLATQHPWSGFVLLNKTGWLLDGQGLGEGPFEKFAGPGK